MKKKKKSRLLTARAALQKCNGKGESSAAIREYLDAKAQADKWVAPDLPLPTGVTASPWDDDEVPWRMVWGPERYVHFTRNKIAKNEPEGVMVCCAVAQTGDGAIWVHDDVEPAVEINLLKERGLPEPIVMTADDARQLAAHLTDVATELDGWITAKSVA